MTAKTAMVIINKVKLTGNTKIDAIATAIPEVDEMIALISTAKPEANRRILAYRANKAHDLAIFQQIDEAIDRDRAANYWRYLVYGPTAYSDDLKQTIDRLERSLKLILITRPCSVPLRKSSMTSTLMPNKT